MKFRIQKEGMISLKVSKDDINHFKTFFDEVITEIKEDAIPMLIVEFKNEFKR